MVLDQLIHRLDFCELRFEFLPVRFQHVLGCES